MYLYVSIAFSFGNKVFACTFACSNHEHGAKPLFVFVVTRTLWLSIGKVVEKKHYILQKVACLWSESSQNFKWKLISCVKAPKVCEIQNKYKQIEKDNSSAGLEIWERHISSAFLKKFSSARHLILCFQFVPSLISTFQFIFLIHKSLFYVHFTLHFACTLFPLTLWLVPIIMHPTGRHPLWFAFQRIDLGQQLLISTICVVVYDYHIEEMTPACLHVAGSGYNVLKLLLLLSVMVKLIKQDKYMEIKLNFLPTRGQASWKRNRRTKNYQRLSGRMRKSFKESLNCIFIPD